MGNEKKTAYDMQYMKAHTVKMTLQLNRTTDAELLSWLDSQENRNGYIKGLIRADMERHQNGSNSLN